MYGARQHKKQSLRFVVLLWLLIPILYFVTLDYVNHVIDQNLERGFYGY